MELEPWVLWLAAGLILFIFEIFTPAFVAACIGLGCLPASLAAHFNASPGIQLLIFAIVTLIAFFTVRPFMVRYAYKRSKDIRTNAESLIGRIGRVTTTIDPLTGTGRVAVDGDDWRAESLNNEVIHAGEKVYVLHVNSITLTVRRDGGPSL
ncbi:MAG: NfeD family protein [Bacteroidota bacterium]|nr:NfeD family protein [Bacteroidota bacterium]